MNLIERMEIDRKLAKVEALEEESERLRTDIEDFSDENHRQRLLLEEARTILARYRTSHDGSDNAVGCDGCPCHTCEGAAEFIAKLAPLLPEAKP